MNENVKDILKIVGVWVVMAVVVSGGSWIGYNVLVWVAHLLAGTQYQSFN